MFLVGTLLRFGFVTGWLFHLIACMGGCLGCDAKSKLMKGQESHLCRPPKPCMAEGVEKSSRCDVDNDVINHDSHGNGNTSQGFINHGFLLWNESRKEWVGNKRKSNQGDQNCEPRLSWNSTYDSLLGSNKPFDKPVPLSEMVDFLVDVWEQDGTYD